MKTNKILWTLIMMACAALSHAQFVQIDRLEYKYNPDKNEVYLTRADDRATLETAVILDSVEFDGVSYPVTEIRASVFSGCSNLKSVTIGNSIKRMSSCVFKNCTSLTSISIPASVEEIAESSFENCKLEYANFQSLESLRSIVFRDGAANPLSCSQKLYVGGKEMTDVTVPDGVTTIRNYTFCGCPGITSLTLPSSLREIGIGAFAGCVGISELVVPEGVTQIGPSAFSGCSGITSLSLPNSLREIGIGAFRGCTGISELVLPEGLTFVGEMAFYGCSSIKEISMPSSIQTIEKDCFKKGYYSDEQMSIERVDYASLESLCAIQFGNEYSNPLRYTKTLLINGEEITDLVIPEGVTSIGKFVFEYCTKLKSLKIPESIKEIKDSFVGCTGLEKVEFASMESLCAISFCGDYNANPLQYAHNLYIDGKEVIDLYIPEGIEAVNPNVFRGSNIISVTMSDDMKWVRFDAFSNCPKLKSIKFGRGIQKIEGALNGCPEFDHVEFDDLNCLWQMDFDIQIYNNPLYFGHHLFSNGEEVKEISFPEGMKQIKRCVLLGCESVERIHVPEGVEVIHPLAFAYCKNLVSIDLPSTLQGIYSSNNLTPFDFCESLEEIRVREGNLHYDSREDCNAAIMSETNILKVGGINTVIPRSVTEIYFKAFYGRKKLTSIFIPSNVVKIGLQSFGECSSLKDFYYDAKRLPDLKNENPFKNTPIENATLHVPENMIEAFRTTAPWSSFGNIVALLPEEIPNNYKEDDYAYRPFVEEGKTWMLGWYENGADPTTTEPKRIEYQYFDGDTILFDVQYKKLMTAEVEGENRHVRYAGAVRENEGIVSFCIAGANYYNTLYDFVSPEGTTNQIIDGYTINLYTTEDRIYPVNMGKKSIIDTETYKGGCREVSFNGETYNWLQGVGYMGLYNLVTEYMGFYRLMSCTVGDEVLYYDASLMPKALEAKKKRLDFTHVVKAQAKAPQQGTEQEGTETLKGEYSPAELFVHLNGLAGTYSITLTDEAGKEVYAKEVLTDNVLALSTDLLTYAPGTYTLTVENEYEKFVTTLNLTTDIASTPAPTQDKDALYDLSGRKLQQKPSKGIYIQNGKVLVK